MFVVLSEIDTLDFLNAHGIYPDEFYMDLHYFKENAVHFNRANVVILFAGITNFRVNNVCAEVKELRTRIKGYTDDGIKSVIVVSDVDLPLDNYYKYYHHNFNKVDLKTNKTVIQKNVDFFESLKLLLGNENNPNNEGKKCYPETLEEIHKRIEHQLREQPHKDEDAYIPKIKTFDIKKELGKL